MNRNLEVTLNHINLYLAENTSVLFECKYAAQVLIEDKYVIFDGKYAKQGPIEAVSSVSYDKLLLITKLWSLQLREKQTTKLLTNLLFFPCNSSVRTSENNSILSGACFSYHKNFRKIIRTMWTR